MSRVTLGFSTARQNPFIKQLGCGISRVPTDDVTSNVMNKHHSLEYIHSIDPNSCQDQDMKA